jgi:hypothetical protein
MNLVTEHSSPWANCKPPTKWNHLEKDSTKNILDMFFFLFRPRSNISNLKGPPQLSWSDDSELQLGNQQCIKSSGYQTLCSSPANEGLFETHDQNSNQQIRIFRGLLKIHQ